MKIPYTSNEVKLPNTSFAAIIGLKVFGYARSPKLWNAVYQKIGCDHQMLSLDVEHENFNNLMSWLRSNDQYLGGAVAAPYKSPAAFFLGENSLHDSSVGIMSVNAIFRVQNEHLRGANTDGLAAFEVLKKAGLQIDDKILIFGFGGVAKAIIKSLTINSSNIIVVTRQFRDEKSIQLANGLGVKLISYQDVVNFCGDASIVINATSVGSATFQPTESVISNETIVSMSKLRIGFDVNYNPVQSVFLEKLPSHVVKINGLEMNLLQAVNAFKLVYSNVSCDLIYDTMKTC